MSSPDLTPDPAGDVLEAPDRTAIPFVDDSTHALLETAVLNLIALRGGRPHDPAARISTLFSLIVDGESWMHELVADARDEGYSWHAIAARLADTISATRHRYATYAIRRRQHPDPCSPRSR